MNKTHYKIIGVMSGTSLDGIDLTYITFKLEDKWMFQIQRFETVPYTTEWLQILQNLVDKTVEDLKTIDSNYTNYLAEKIKAFIKKFSIVEIDAICSHGHTALHQPEKGLTYQIGNREALAVLTNNKVVCDFRVQDVALGGQGAPLVPIGDRILFSEYDYCINLGGFANISFETENQRIAFDICPVNIILNYYVKQLGLAYDDHGEIAASGTLNHELLKELNAINYYSVLYPKSLGLEWVKLEFFPIIDSYNLEIKDILRTCIEHCAIQISNAIHKSSSASVLLTGGGTFNTFLVSRMKTLISHDLVIPSEALINYKEALIFGFLGVLKLRNQVNCLSSVTGAKYDHSSGKIYLP